MGPVATAVLTMRRRNAQDRALINIDPQKVKGSDTHVDNPFSSKRIHAQLNPFAIEAVWLLYCPVSHGRFTLAVYDTGRQSGNRRTR